MKTKRNHNHGSLPAAVGTGTLVTLIALVLGCMLFTTLVISGNAGEGIIPKAIFMLLLSSAFLGSLITAVSCEKTKIVAAGIYVACILFILCGMNIIMFGGTFQSGLPKVLSVLLGAVLGYFAACKPRKKRGKIKSR